MKRMLMVATVAPTIGQFNMDNLQLLLEMGIMPEVAADFKDDSVWSKERMEQFQNDLKAKGIDWHQIDFTRHAGDLSVHGRAYRQMRKLLQENEYAFIHCHTPIAGAIARLAARKEKVPAIYTAHGFHFYKGAPLMNWILFYPVERIMARFTEVLITINAEDTRRSKRFHPHYQVYVPGVGVNLGQFCSCPNTKEELRQILYETYGIRKDGFMVLSVGELNTNKNHHIMLRAIADLPEELKNQVSYVICGKGQEREALLEEASVLGISERVYLPGFCKEITSFYQAADLFTFPSYREGLSVPVMEAMASGLPVLASDIRGNRDLIRPEKGGFLIHPENELGFSRYMEMLFGKPELCAKMGDYNRRRVARFGRDDVDEKLKAIYQMVAKERKMEDE